MKYTRRQQLFVDYYSDPGSETCGNADKSALKAHLTPTLGCKLLKRDYIKEAIKNKQQECAIKTSWDRETKAKIAKENFLKSTKPRDTEFWWTEMCRLEGDYITKIESTLEDKRIERLDAVQEHINRILQEKN